MRLEFNILSFDVLCEWKNSYISQHQTLYGNILLLLSSLQVII